MIRRLIFVVDGTANEEILFVYNFVPKLSPARYPGSRSSSVGKRGFQAVDKSEWVVASRIYFGIKEMYSIS